MVTEGENLRERHRRSRESLKSAEQAYKTNRDRLRVQKAQLRLARSEDKAGRAAERSELASRGLKQSFWTGKVVRVRRSRDGKKAHLRRTRGRQDEGGEALEG